VIPKFNIEDIDPSLGSGVHPAFVVNGVVKKAIYVAQYSASLEGGIPYSLPGRLPSLATYNNAVAACSALGTGFHMMTLSELSAITLWCWKNGYLPRGNTDFGRSDLAKFESGRRADGRRGGDQTVATTADAFVRTGSGPISWRHNNDVTGIADLVGDYPQWAAGARLVNGEIQIMADNDAANPNEGHGPSSANWRAINESDGVLMTPGLAGSLKYNASMAGTGNSTKYGSPILSTSITNRNGTFDGSSGQGYCSGAMNAIAEAAEVDTPVIMRRLTLSVPVDGYVPIGDHVQVRNYGERMLDFGGTYSWGSLAGVFARRFMATRVSNLRFRAVYTG
jgi:hypothetical protein